MEQFHDNDDRQVEIIGEIIETMQGHSVTGGPENQVVPAAAGHQHRIPPPIDFKANAAEAIRGGIFAIAGEPRRILDPDVLGPVQPPDSLLDTPYSNGPAVIRMDETDVPIAIMGAVRKNFVAANRLLLPTDQLMSYFHQQFTREDPLKSNGVQESFTQYDPEVPSHMYVNVNTDDVSFRLDVDRSKHDRHLFTAEELKATLLFTHDNPEIPMAIAAYQGTILDYLYMLRNEFINNAVGDARTVSWDDIDKFDIFIKNWATPNFYKEILPAMMLLSRNAHQENADQPAAPIISSELFGAALDFLFKNGAFRNFVDVPAHVAISGQERTNKFLCPAVSVIREQLIDGQLLGRLYHIARSRLAAGDPAAEDMVERIDAKINDAFDQMMRNEADAQRRAEEEASQTFRMETSGMSLPHALAKAMLFASYREKSAIISYNGVEYAMPSDLYERTVEVGGTPQSGDCEISTSFRDTLDEAIGRAISTAASADVPAFFSFNNTIYRVTPANAKMICATE